MHHATFDLAAYLFPGLSRLALRLDVAVVFLLAFCLSLPASLMAQASCDFNADGLSDYVKTTAGTNGLSWSVSSGADATAILSEDFGVTGSLLIVGHWTDAERPTLGTVAKSSASTTLTWDVLLENSQISSENLGRTGDLVLTAADFDGNGIADAAVVRVVKSQLRWLIKPNMFADAGALRRVTFGKNGDRAFFVNAEGDADWLGVFGPGSNGKGRLILRQLNSKKRIRASNLPKALTTGDRPRPFPVQDAEGKDLLAFVSYESAKTNVWMYTVRGKRLTKSIFSGTRTVLVGEFDDDQAGEEILLQSSSSRILYNPSTGSVARSEVAASDFVDEISIDVVPEALVIRD